MKKVLFIDRDGTLILEPPDEQIDSLEKLEYYPGVFSGLGKIARDTDFELVIVTNQDGLGTASFPEETFWPAQNKMLKTFENEGIRFPKIFVDRSFARDNQPTRKPGTGMLTEFFNGQYDLANSYVIGDRITDVELAKNLGAKAILINNGSLTEKVAEKGLTDYCSLVTTSWQEIYTHVTLPDRKATVTRTTKETDIRITLNLDGQGKSSIHTGLGFFDHMLDQLARHGNMDLDITVKGDLHIDEHHTIEDTALALGEAFVVALGTKRGIERYGFTLPMDECLAQVAIDFGGRPWLVWSAEFKREKIGEMPTEMFFHFFKSFSDTSKSNLNIKVEGDNEHHKIESIFKAFAKAIKMAVKREGNQLPTTKGVI
ncbi:bifunctional histidinol-phosphatase/imidazoleglycerol-phosphate dehydratase HisB [Chryseolinea lacunae]|uniref:Histidine biosynthesis bifunctional protein HisB n=1 Tax=Chryseolinea lacunae TaxID=2801331 RepID=A0ABS1KXW2_9BACT|nr:bifunctional histidinol-phosphatase/imidazoleglycerol-phosphate dehydratase HisB [Chryseolinea lacunae]MBL0744092.1 bifunctional histidinol-phosphatase/imidazoleglycerol-phosphate dehydratase HisB [Chryseolinea lacunae]